MIHKPAIICIFVFIPILISGLVEEVKEILLEGEDDDFDSIPINLEAIKKIMSECKDQSAAVVEKFESVYRALNELVFVYLYMYFGIILQENSVRRSGEADNTLTDLEKDEKANEHENEKILAEIERLDKEESSLHDEIAKTDQNMQKARDDVFRQQEVISMLSYDLLSIILFLVALLGKTK